MQHAPGGSALRALSAPRISSEGRPRWNAVDNFRIVDWRGKCWGARGFRARGPAGDTPESRGRAPADGAKKPPPLRGAVLPMPWTPITDGAHRVRPASGLPSHNSTFVRACQAPAPRNQQRGSQGLRRHRRRRCHRSQREALTGALQWEAAGLLRKGCDRTAPGVPPLEQRWGPQPPLSGLRFPGAPSGGGGDGRGAGEKPKQRRRPGATRSGSD